MKAVAIKVVIAALLVGWLVHTGTLELGAVRVLVDEPRLLASTLAALALGVVIGALRWRLLLRLADVRLSRRYAIELQLIGLFFNIAIPGGIGGDVAKAIYAAREAAPEKRATVYIIGVVDRLIGASSLVLVAVAALALQGPEAWRVPELASLASVVAVLAVVSLIAPAIVVVALRRSTPPREPRSGRIGRVLDSLLQAARLVSAAPATLATALGLAVVMHLAGSAVFVLLADAISASATPAASVFAVYPLGMLTVMVPISYAGIGVGHLAFERLFALLGMTNGASVFNAYFIAQTAPCLLGVIPYLRVRRRQAPPTQSEAALQQAPP